MKIFSKKPCRLAAGGENGYSRKWVDCSKKGKATVEGPVTPTSGSHGWNHRKGVCIGRDVACHKAEPSRVRMQKKKTLQVVKRRKHQNHFSARNNRLECERGT